MIKSVDNWERLNEKTGGNENDPLTHKGTLKFFFKKEKIQMKKIVLVLLISALLVVLHIISPLNGIVGSILVTKEILLFAVAHPEVTITFLLFEGSFSVFLILAFLVFVVIKGLGRFNHWRQQKKENFIKGLETFDYVCSS